MHLNIVGDTWRGELNPVLCVNQWEMVAVVRVGFFHLGERKMHEEKGERLLFSSIILATTFLHLPSSYTSFFHFAKQYLEPPIPTGSPSTLAAVLPFPYRVPFFCT